MSELSNEEKKLLKKKYLASQERKYILSKAKARSLFRFLENRLEEFSCDHTRRFTLEWLNENVPPEKRESVIAEIEEMGGYCDCEVIMNCYDRYNLA